VLSELATDQVLVVLLKVFILIASLFLIVSLGLWVRRWLRTSPFAEVVVGWLIVFVGAATFGFGVANWYDSARTSHVLPSRELSQHETIAKEQITLAAKILATEPEPGRRSLVPFVVAVPLTLLGAAVFCGGCVATNTAYNRR
jgi:hypothetical protein